MICGDAGVSTVALDAGGFLVVARLFGLARSPLDLLPTSRRTAGRGAGFRPPADPWAETTTAHGRFVLIILRGLAEFERELILVRTGEGRMPKNEAYELSMR